MTIEEYLRSEIRYARKMAKKNEEFRHYNEGLLDGFQDASEYYSLVRVYSDLYKFLIKELEKTEEKIAENKKYEMFVDYCEGERDAYLFVLDFIKWGRGND